MSFACPTCKHPKTFVIDSRPNEGDGNIVRRRRKCRCGARFSTYELTMDDYRKLADSNFYNTITENNFRDKVVDAVKEAFNALGVNDEPPPRSMNLRPRTQEFKASPNSGPAKE